eukprot:TRINITY_DN9367_c0_g1_i1.p2 TRINITY_DN9367_c0_g1~~TRINITY_DN9367_c0_g1_i1.p2  ORF type:complete len:516 (+),score=198.52 TRINITY_DN9367_c0_g1_i1:1032-2579(+)
MEQRVLQLEAEVALAQERLLEAGDKAAQLNAQLEEKVECAEQLKMLHDAEQAVSRLEDEVSAERERSSRLQAELDGMRSPRAREAGAAEQDGPDDGAGREGTGEVPAEDSGQADDDKLLYESDPQRRLREKLIRQMQDEMAKLNKKWTKKLAAKEAEAAQLELRLYEVSRERNAMQAMVEQGIDMLGREASPLQMALYEVNFARLRDSEAARRDVYFVEATQGQGALFLSWEAVAAKIAMAEVKATVAREIEQANAERDKEAEIVDELRRDIRRYTGEAHQLRQSAERHQQAAQEKELRIRELEKEKMELEKVCTDALMPAAQGAVSGEEATELLNETYRQQVQQLYGRIDVLQRESDGMQEARYRERDGLLRQYEDATEAKRRAEEALKLKDAELGRVSDELASVRQRCADLQREMREAQMQHTEELELANARCDELESDTRRVRLQDSIRSAGSDPDKDRLRRELAEAREALQRLQEDHGRFLEDVEVTVNENDELRSQLREMESLLEELGVR